MLETLKINGKSIKVKKNHQKNDFTHYIVESESYNNALIAMGLLESDYPRRNGVNHLSITIERETQKVDIILYVVGKYTDNNKSIYSTECKIDYPKKYVITKENEVHNYGYTPQKKKVFIWVDDNYIRTAPEDKPWNEKRRLKCDVIINTKN